MFMVVFAQHPMPRRKKTARREQVAIKRQAPRATPKTIAVPAASLRIQAVVAASLIVATLAAFWPALDNGFVSYDDDKYILENPAVTGGLTAASIRWAFGSTYASNWHPLTWLSHMADCAVYGINPRGHHLTSILLHATNTGLVFMLLAALTGSTWGSALAALLFAIHPLRVESVVWVSERKDVLSAFLGLLALMAYTAYARRRSRTSYVASVGLFALALMAKPMLVTLPFLLLLLDWWPLDRVKFTNGHAGTRAGYFRLLVEKTPFWLLSAMSAVITYWAQQHGGAVRNDEIFTAPVRIGNAITAYGAYLRQTVWPTGLAAFYPHPGYVQVAPMVWALVTMVAVSVLSVASLKKNPAVLMGWLWFLGSLTPVLGIVQVGLQTRADRYTYLPHIGLFMAIVWLVRAVTGRQWQLQMAAVIFGLGAGLALGLVTRAQTRVWRDTTALFTHALDVTTGNFVAHNSLGSQLLNAGKFEEAEQHLRAALEIQPSAYTAKGNLGLVLTQRGNYTEAIELFKAVLTADPSDFRAHNALGNAYVKIGSYEKAIDEFHSALALAPNHRAVLHNLESARQSAARSAAARR